MEGISKRDQYKLLKRLRRRVKELTRTPIYHGRKNIENINIDDLAVELVLKFCNIDRVIKKVEELRHDKQK